MRRRCCGRTRQIRRSNTLPTATSTSAAGISIRVIDLYSLAPIAKDALIAAGKATRGQIITVEDHYAAGGIGDAVSAAVSEESIRVHRIAVREIPRSGKPEELLDRYGISASHIADAVRALQ